MKMNHYCPKLRHLITNGTFDFVLQFHRKIYVYRFDNACIEIEMEKLFNYYTEKMC